MKKYLGQRSAPDIALPQLRGLKTIRTRTLAAGVDASAATVAEAERINLSQSRYGVNNVLLLNVKSTAAGVTVDLYWKPDADVSDFFFLSSQTTTRSSQTLQFENIPGGVVVPVITAIPADVTLSGGVTD